MILHDHIKINKVIEIPKSASNELQTFITTRSDGDLLSAIREHSEMIERAIIYGCKGSIETPLGPVTCFSGVVERLGYMPDSMPTIDIIASSYFKLGSGNGCQRLTLFSEINFNLI